MPPISLHLADCDDWRPAIFAATLSADEQARAQRFHHSLDRDRFIVRRGLLHRLLGERLGIEASRVPLEPGPAGKPMLAAAELRRAGVATANGPPGFNLARSGGLALYAFLPLANARAVTGPAAPDGPAIGVDLERIDTARRTLADLRRIADHFAPEESRFLEGLPDDEAAAVFYRLWTCKEACLKCLGTGIGGGGPTLADVVIALSPDGTVSGTARTASGRFWRVACLTPCPGSTAAVAVPAAEATSGENLPLEVALQQVDPEAAERAVSRVAVPPPERAPEAP
ncbi:MAG: 4'-phosphopantetheinyl transferase superfamily protein [Planctomycetia bacterium]